jgi:hypothetical protein
MFKLTEKQKQKTNRKQNKKSKSLKYNKNSELFSFLYFFYTREKRRKKQNENVIHLPLGRSKMCKTNTQLPPSKAHCNGEEIGSSWLVCCSFTVRGRNKKKIKRKEKKDRRKK